MKFFGSIVVYGVLGLILAAGVVQSTHGHFWLLAAGIVGYLALLIKLGCLPPSESH